jgi:predicted aspartyl protease
MAYACFMRLGNRLASILILVASLLGGHAAATGLDDAVPQQTPVSPPPPLISPATVDDSLEVTGETIGARQINTRVAIGVMINGKGPFRFLVDSGADRSVVGARLASILDLQPSGIVRMNSISGTSQVQTVRIDSLQVGSSEMFGINAPALLEQHLGAQGLLGIDALAEQRLSMDFVGKTITIQDPRRPERSAGGLDEIVVTARRRRGQLILTEASINNRRLNAVIDTGAQMTIGNSALYDRVFGRRSSRQPVITTLTSVTGEPVTARLAFLPELRIGRLTLQNVAVAFVDVPPFKLFGLADQPSLLLGTDVLEAFRRVSLDFRNRKVRFVLRD